MKQPNTDLTIYEVPLDTLKEYPGNPRIGNVKSLAESLNANGQFRPIIVRKETGEILGGNHTWKAAKKLKWETIKVMYLENITDEEAKKIVLADNRISDMSAYDNDNLLSLLKSLEGDVVGTGYDNDDITVLLNSITEINTKSEKAVLEAPEEFPSFSTETPTEHKCPKCSYEWNGKTR